MNTIFTRCIEAIPIGIVFQRGSAGLFTWMVRIPLYMCCLYFAGKFVQGCTVQHNAASVVHYVAFLIIP